MSALSSTTAPIRALAGAPPAGADAHAGLWLEDLWERGPSRHRGLWNRSEDRFLSALFVAGALHLAVILGVTFSKPDPPARRTSTLDVVLVQQASETTPDDATFLAQANQNGGGQSERVERPASPLPAPFTAPTAEVVTAAPPPVPDALPANESALAAMAAPDEETRPVLTRDAAAPEKAVRRPPRPRPRPQSLARVALESAPVATSAPAKPRINAIELVTKSLAYASANAELEQRVQQYAAKPKHKWITARTRESKYAAYMDSWRTKVERIGNLNYPEAARRKRLSGSLLLDVAINPDGSVSEVLLRRSSGHRVLDDAAVRIVKLAAPFAPLPIDIRREVDILHIERTWQFLRSNRLSSG